MRIVIFYFPVLFLIAMFSLPVSSTDSSTETSPLNVYPYSLYPNQTTLPPLPMTLRSKPPIDPHPSNDTERLVHLQPLEDSQNHVVHLEGEIDKHGRLQQLVDILLSQDLSSVNKENLKQIVRKHHDLYLDERDIEVRQTEEHNDQFVDNLNEDQNHAMQLLQPYNIINIGRNKMQPEVSNTSVHGNQFQELHLPILDVRMHFEEIPLMQKKQTQEEIKKSLDDYTMQRRKTHYVFPELNNDLDINYILRNNNSKSKRSVLSSSDSDFQTNRSKSESDNNEFSDKIKVEIAKSNIIKENSGFVDDDKLKSVTFDPQMIENIANQNMLDAMKEQSEKMYDLIRQIQKENKRRSAFSDFEMILKNVDDRKKMKKVVKKTSTTTTATTLSVQEMLIDETMVREALRNDPYVKRILQLSNMKKEQFFKTMN